MARRARVEMIEETRSKLIKSARLAFATMGFINTSMDDFTAAAGLTRGALYHHFGDKRGLFAAVVQQLDTEMDQHLQSISETASDPWNGLRDRCRAYLTMALDAEIQQIILKDSKAILGERFEESQLHCISSIRGQLSALIQDRIIRDVDAEALARLINGSLVEAAFWIANNDKQPETRLEMALLALDLLLDGLKTK